MWDLIVSVPDHCLSLYLTISEYMDQTIEIRKRQRKKQLEW